MDQFIWAILKGSTHLLIYFLACALWPRHIHLSELAEPILYLWTLGDFFEKKTQMNTSSLSHFRTRNFALSANFTSFHIFPSQKIGQFMTQTLLVKWFLQRIFVALPKIATSIQVNLHFVHPFSILFLVFEYYMFNKHHAGLSPRDHSITFALRSALIFLVF